MPLIHFFKDAFRFLPPRLFGYLTISGDSDECVRLRSTSYDRLSPQNGPGYGEPPFKDEATELAAAKSLIAEIESKKGLTGYKRPFLTVTAAYGPTSKIEITSKEKFTFDDGGRKTPLIAGEHSFSIRGIKAKTLRRLIALNADSAFPQGTQVFVDSDTRTNELEGLTFQVFSAEGQAHVSTIGLTPLPYRPMTLRTTKSHASQLWPKERCKGKLDDFAKGRWLPTTTDTNVNAYIDGNNIKHILGAIDDTFLPLDDKATIVRVDQLEGARICLNWETPIAVYSQVMRLATT